MDARPVLDELVALLVMEQERTLQVASGGRFKPKEIEKRARLAQEKEEKKRWKEAQEGRKHATFAVLSTLVKNLGAYLGPFDAWCVSVTCKDLVPLAKKYNRDLIVDSMSNSHKVSYARCKPLVNLITLQYAQNRLCSVCKGSYIGRFALKHGVYAHHECIKHKMTPSWKWSSKYFSADSIDAQALRDLPGEERPVRDESFRMAWELRDWCVKDELTLSNMLRQSRPEKWKEEFKHKEDEISEIHLTSLINFGRLNKLKDELSGKGATVVFGDCKRRQSLADLVEEYKCWSVICDDFLTKLNSSVSHDAAVARLAPLIANFRKLRTTLLSKAFEELREIKWYTGLDPKTDKWTDLLAGTNFQLIEAFILLCSKPTQKDFLKYFINAARDRLCVLRAEYVCDEKKLNINSTNFQDRLINFLKIQKR